MRMFDASRSARLLPAARFIIPLLFVLAGEACLIRPLFATDYFLTIGGGYSPSGNQASLEANVIFFQTILREQHRGSRVHEVFFADGTDSAKDLQVLRPQAQPRLPATELLASLHRRGGAQQVEYRNHLVPDIAGANSPDSIRASLGGIARKARSPDRLIIYVTAHGSAAKGRDPYNTTIDCWGNKSITVREFSEWLDGFSPDVPVLMVMAQCYCGGFAHAIFQDDQGTKNLAKQVRAGFFAQQHNLAAAGCRPDIDNDDEFSSYFWGAIAGRSRTGAPVSGCDLDGDGTVSFAEAYAYAVTASKTIDIPLRASEALLRKYSRNAHSESPKSPADEAPSEPADPAADTAGDATADSADDARTEAGVPRPDLSAMTGTLESLVEGERPVTRHIVAELSGILGLSLQDDVSAVRAAYETQRRQGRTAGRGGFGGGPRRRPGGGRPELLKEIAEKWPELADQKKWESSPLLRAENQTELLADLEKLPSFELYEQRRRQRAELSDQSEQNELREIKYRRLIDALEVIVLARNLPLVATPEIVQRYREMVALEESSLTSGSIRR